jgi:ribosome-binding factor A
MPETPRQDKYFPKRISTIQPERFGRPLPLVFYGYPKQEVAMPENRGRKHHQDRVAESLREEIDAMIEGELSDPRIGFCHVSEVVLNAGGKSAYVYVVVDGVTDGIDEAEEETIAGLEAANGYIHRELKERMGVRHVPDLSFLADRSDRFKARIDELMTRTRRRKKTPALAAEVQQ